MMTEFFKLSRRLSCCAQPITKNRGQLLELCCWLRLRDGFAQSLVFTRFVHTYENELDLSDRSWSLWRDSVAGLFSRADSATWW